MKTFWFISVLVFCFSPTFADTPPCLPINDDPCIDSENPPFDLTSVYSHTGTTCCARGFNDPNNGDDLRNIDCSTITDDNAVWYIYTPTGDEDGFMISVLGNGITGNTAVEVYWGAPDAGCTQGVLAETATSGCGALSFEDNIGNCPPNDGDVLFVKVASQDEDCGEFTIILEPSICRDFANTCEEITGAQILEPITDPNGMSIDYICVSSCLDFACTWTEPIGEDCGFTEWPTIWFEINTDDIAAQMFSTVEPWGTWDAIWSVYTGPNCDSLEQVVTSVSTACSNWDDTPDLHQIPVFDTNNKYWIAVTVDPASLPTDDAIDNGSFDLCVATIINTLECIGEDESSCQDESLTIAIIEREHSDQPLEGPFCQGEEVTISITFNYDASDSGSDWLIGFVPEFGPGWDLENFDFDANAPSGNGSTAQWFDEDGDCAPILQEPLPHMCTYEDEDGNLRLCNALCEACSDCPDGIGMMQGDPLPSGYFWVTNGGNASCENDCSPGEGWGIGTTVVDIFWEFTLSVKEFNSVEDCLDSRSLRISFQTFSDGVAGCWEDPVGECLIDRLQVGPSWVVDCNAPPSIVGDSVEICTGSAVDLSLSNVDGSTYPITVTFQDNPFVEGEGSGSNGLYFPGGFGTINDVLTNNSNAVQTVTYTAQSDTENDFSCPSLSYDFIVQVYPDLVIEFPPNSNYICQGNCNTLTPVISGTSDTNLVYTWSTGELSPSIDVCPFIVTTYCVTVSDPVGCTGSQCVEVDIKDSLVIDMGDDLTICQDGMFDGLNPEFIITSTIMQGSEPVSYAYDTEPGLIGSEIFPGAWGINEEASIDSIGDGLQLCFLAEDFFGCQTEECITIQIKSPNISINAEPLECNETLFCPEIIALDGDNEPVPDLLLEDCDANTLWELSGSIDGIFYPPCIDLVQNKCFKIIATNPITGYESILYSEQEISNIGPEILLDDITTCSGDTALFMIENYDQFDSVKWFDELGVLLSSDSFFTSVTDLAKSFVVRGFTEDCQSEKTVFHFIDSYVISGSVYIDENENGEYDSGDTPLVNTLVTDITTGMAVLSDANGTYTISPGIGGLHTLEALQNVGIWQENPVVIQEIDLDENCQTHIDIPFYLAPAPPEIDITISSYLTRCDTEVRFFIDYENIGSEPVSGTLFFNYDGLTEYVLSTNIGMDDGTTVSWDVENFQPHIKRRNQITLQMPPAQLPFPTMSFVGAFEDEFGGDAEVYTYNSLLRCSYDPNDKSVQPDRTGDANQTLFDESINYTIRFQNNGNDTSFLVTIVDELDDNIIPSSVRVLSSSHYVQTSIEGQLLTFTFPDIQLVDSITNYEASQGYVTFSCHTVDGLDEQSIITNHAGIIFDTNPPIVTNSVKNTLVSKLCSNIILEESVTICEGEDYLGYTETGTYTTTTPVGNLGCDSIYTVTIDKISRDTQDVELQLCDGELSIFNGKIYDEEGVFQDSIISEEGCVSNYFEIEVFVTDIPIVTANIDPILCPGDTMIFTSTTDGVLVYIK